MIQLSILDTLLATAPLVLAIALFKIHLNKTREISIASARMVLQLIAIGYLLTMLFTYDYWWLGLIVLTFMMGVAARIAMRPLSDNTYKSYGINFVAITIGAGINLAWMLLAVLKLSPWYQPQSVIPLAGMVFSAAMNALSIGGERYQSECSQGHTHAKAAAFNAATMSHVNMLLAVGLVSLPGMMTGQILSGVSPLIAVRYQIMVMSMVVGTSCLTLTIYFWLRELVKTDNPLPQNTPTHS